MGIGLLDTQKRPGTTMLGRFLFTFALKLKFVERLYGKEEVHVF